MRRGGRGEERTLAAQARSRFFPFDRLRVRMTTEKQRQKPIQGAFAALRMTAKN
jgi:hypothetical protein